MQRSIIERVFPKPKRPLLPQYDETASSYHDEEHHYSITSTPGLHPDSHTSKQSTSKSSRRSSHGSQSKSQSRSQLQPAPLSASIIHHDDPFLAIDRAAATLQRTIQSLLDFQSQALSGRHQEETDAASTQRSISPSLSRTGLSTTTHDFGISVVGTVPIRQPRQKNPTLRSTRRSIVKSMQEFAALKEEELKITQDETSHRRTALAKATDLETKREAVQHEIHTLQERSSGHDANNLRSEAQSVEQEIHELEGRLMELKARHRHLVHRATQLENTAASELSSYEGTLALIDKDTRSFLTRPPVKQSLGPRNLAHRVEGQDMYALRPERRTLELAKEQWAGELDLLQTHSSDIEREKQALLDGAEMWKETIQKIDHFEHNLRLRMKEGSGSSSDIVTDLDSTVHFLQAKLSQAESQHWTLLFCAIGAELEAFRQARALLVPGETPPTSDGYATNGISDRRSHTEEEDSDVPHADLLGAQSPELTSSHLNQPNHNNNDLEQSLIEHDHQDSRATDTASSNESLQATLHAFPPSAALSASVPTSRDNHNRDHKRTSSASASASASPSNQLPTRRLTRYSESEDDDPGPDFLVSH
ncbi:hypothetical protein PMZ80_004190 [Knufia obscura]|uniref:Uncharacterized protein n=2 Tax=Knufia TaxID=430999 RepID=A0AAN8E8D3_9EURO|nr:hypothetical protein PMZ80_004190 [Knufia obscura]KAK5948684.1 hypothetical protein OHC33_010287 [Knufia fluminis]